MKRKVQSKSSRMDESLGMKHGAERKFNQSMKSRRNESEGMKNHKKGRGSSCGNHNPY